MYVYIYMKSNMQIMQNLTRPFIAFNVEKEKFLQIKLAM